MKVITIDDDGNPRPLTKTERQRLYRATGSSKALEPKPPGAPGRVEQSVVEECGAYPLTQECPAIYAQARKLAENLDNPELMGMWPQCGRQLVGLLNQLRPKARPNAKRLAVVRRMAR